MFKHQGNSRTLKQNLKIASLLSFVAGMVNVAGFLTVERLTTNVTGHFAFFVDELFKLDFWKGFVYFLYIFFFFLGSFVSSTLVELISKKNDNYIYVVPAFIESLILFAVAYFGNIWRTEYPNLLAYCLLFAMGLQNSLVTKISNATVRTTHLTGLFTDLGIELSHLMFKRYKEKRPKLYESLKLRASIIGFFALGGILGGIFFAQLGIHILVIAGIALLIGIALDYIKLKFFQLKRKTHSKIIETTKTQETKFSI